MTSNRVADEIQQEPGSGSPKVSTGSAVGGHDHLKDAPHDDEFYEVVMRLQSTPFPCGWQQTVADINWLIGQINLLRWENCQLRDGRPAAGAD